MLSILTWLPIIGPIVEGFFGFLNKRQDNALAKYQTGVTADTEDAKTSARIIEATRDDLGTRLARDIIIFPVAIWTGLLSWDTIVAESSFSGWMWHLASFEKTGAPYLPYAVLVYLLGNAGFNAWKRR